MKHIRYNLKILYFNILLIIFLNSWSISAKILKPGTYRNLKADKSIVLDTGSYTFIGLEMKNLGKGIWLDARKARSLTLINCRFEGTEMETGVFSAKITRLQKCCFRQLQTAIQAENGPTDSLIVEQNFFENNTFSICSDAEGLTLEMSGNVFLTDETKSRTGLYLSPTGSLDHSVGGEGNRMSDGRLPAGNLWPVSRKQPDTLAYLFLPLHSWVGRQTSPVGWRSLVNAHPQAELRYFAFGNEFVSGSVCHERLFIHQNHMPPYCYAFSPIDSAVAQKMEALGQWYEVKLPEGYSFPFKWWFSTDPNHRIQFELRQLDTTSKRIQMGNLVADLQNQQARVPVFIPYHLSVKGEIVIRKQGSKAVVKTYPVENVGRQEKVFSTKFFEKGMYWYEIWLEGRAYGSRQWVYL